MKIRTEALLWALRRLPAPYRDGPRVYEIGVSEFRESCRVPLNTTHETTTFQRLTFRREQYAEGRERWYEWTLEVAD